VNASIFAKLTKFFFTFHLSNIVDTYATSQHPNPYDNCSQPLGSTFVEFSMDKFIGAYLCCHHIPKWICSTSG